VVVLDFVDSPLRCDTPICCLHQCDIVDVYVPCWSLSFGSYSYFHFKKFYLLFQCSGYSLASESRVFFDLKE